ncbi:MAG TPA: 6-pyruvoyl-tetrahydropterin synthase-related protein [Candidatus Acidoferrales bacterium]|nr:6-pyruvoyl-tetrahydropterin synthase-related protein [Candidatus Acidoferrales bacterium]
MVDPYHMVLVNVIASIILLIGIVIYYYIYPKKKINLLFLLIIISLLPLISLLRKGTYESGLLSENVGVVISFYNSLMDGILKPMWSANACSGYGCPLFIFQYPLPFYVASFFHYVGFSFISSVKLMLAVAFIASGVAMYFWAKDELGKISGFSASIFYLFAPYHLASMHFRVSVGEVLSFVFPPLVLLFSKKIVETGKFYWIFLSAAALALLVLSHQVTSFATFPFIIAYIIFMYFRNKNKEIKYFLYSFMSILLGIFLSAFYWIPVLAERNYMKLALANEVVFQPFWYYIYSPFQYRFGLLFQGQHGELYTNVGYASLIILAISLFLHFTNRINKSNRSFYLFLLVSFFIYFIMMQQITSPIWYSNHILIDIEFTWRFLIEISFIIAMIAGITLKSINKKWFTILVCMFAILVTILNWGNRKMLSQVTDTNFINAPMYIEKPCITELSTPIWVDNCASWIGTFPKNHLQVLKGNATVKQIYRTSIKHSYVVDANTRVLLKENTYYYPGWTVYANDKEIPIIKNNSQYKGIITFNLPKGLYKIDVVFKRTLDRIIGDTISLITFILLIIIALLKKILLLLNSKKFKKSKRLIIKL